MVRIIPRMQAPSSFRMKTLPFIVGLPMHTHLEAISHRGIGMERWYTKENNSNDIQDRGEWIVRQACCDARLSHERLFVLSCTRACFHHSSSSLAAVLSPMFHHHHTYCPTSHADNVNLVSHNFNPPRRHMKAILEDTFFWLALSLQYPGRVDSDG